MSAQVTILQLPAAGAITGTEPVPIVQNGVTVQTTTGAIANSPTQTYSYLTVSQTPQLPNSRYVGATNGLIITDAGAQGLFNIDTTGALLSLVNSGTGFQVKTSSTAITGRSIAVSGSGLSISNGSGISGDPTMSLSGLPATLAGLTGSGMLALVGGSSINPRTITGTTNQIGLANGDGQSGDPTISLASDAVLPGTGAVTVPSGTTGQQPVGSAGQLRYNTTTGRFVGFQSGNWYTFGQGDGTVTSVSGTGNQISVANSTTTPQISFASDPQFPGNGSILLPSGTTAQRSSGPLNGMLRYNTSTATLEAYANNAWGGIVSGTGVTSVTQTFTGGLIAVSGSPITSAGTLALTVSGTSGGIPFFSSASTWATSGVLAANSIMIGGGAATSPSTVTTGTSVLTALGINVGTAGSFVVNGGALGTPSSGTVTNLTGTAAINITGTAPAGTLTGTILNATVVTSSLTTVGTIGSGTWQGTAVGAAYGGTGQTTYAVGDIIYASAATTLSKLADVATGNALISGGVTTAPSWGKIGLTTHVSGTLPIANGGTNGTAVPTAGAVAYGTGTAIGYTAAGTTGQVLTSATAGIPTWTTPTTGTVTSVGFTGGIITVATPTTTPAFTVAGTSGGIPYFSSASTWATSAALAASAIVIGGGAGVAPSTTTTGTGVLTALGTNVGTAGAFVVNGGALGTPSSGTVTNLSGTASININGTVGATTPTTGVFTTVTATTGISGGTF